ncbi:MAG: pyruvate ferredoxin oxidoreductase [Candidatus Moranbacteria bacterium CG06_land_8_20_14_3_00_40_12]|nr:MAG: pyruvate ferredoxin oxidoreductase [Candidatus Moranbacteria bacterium CG23_combo_of_CG06-09_8_20_14_all_40_16]PIU81077.1 MAG: pyruvate ferredoxin oxidoreductase [Candidatus Moranbacteria bacterium CG06_land_8_20_14_3_00_40_12]
MTDKKIALTGAMAAAEALRQLDIDVFSVYPITPQTPIIEAFAKMKSEGNTAAEIIQVESEHSALSACVGASASGARTATATSSQGLALMNEILYIVSGLRLPILMVVSARALSAPINIHGDHSDVMGARDSGWIQIFSENSQEAYDNTLIGMKLAEKTSLPVMSIMDGFNTSHSVENLEILRDETVRKWVGDFTPENSLLNHKNPVTFGPLVLPNSYFEFKIDQEKTINEAVNEYGKIAKEFEQLSGRKKDCFEQYRMADAREAIVLSGSAAGTAKEAVDKLRASGKKAGLLKINLFRPFPRREVARALAKVPKIAVLDRSQSMGTFPPLYTEIVNSLFPVASYKSRVISYVYGLGGRDIFQTDMEKVFEELEKGKTENRIKYIK